MNVYVKALPLILGGVFLNAFAQIAMKKAVQAVGMSWTLPGLWRTFVHPWMLGCLACYAVSVVLWAAAMNRVEVNFAYPFVALGFVAGAFLSRLMLGEQIPPLRWVALGVIVAGVALQALSGRPGKGAAHPAGEGRGEIQAGGPSSR